MSRQSVITATVPPSLLHMCVFDQSLVAAYVKNVRDFVGTNLPPISYRCSWVFVKSSLKELKMI